MRILEVWNIQSVSTICTKDIPAVLAGMSEGGGAGRQWYLDSQIGLGFFVRPRWKPCVHLAWTLEKDQSTTFTGACVICQV